MTPYMNMNQSQLLHAIYEVSFAMNDVTLFLDTHPDDCEALAYFKEVQQLRKQALEIYAKRFGPLLIDDVCADNYWSWAAMPLPWEN